MATIRQYLRNLKQFRTTILDIQADYVLSQEKEIIKLNFYNIDNQIGSDGGDLKSLNPKFTGFYSLSTELIASVENPLAPKKAGEPYNFVWTGDFAGNFEVEVDSSLTKIRIFSTGTGSGKKADFFNDYINLFGLPPKDQLWLRNEIMKALQRQARKYI